MGRRLNLGSMFANLPVFSLSLSITCMYLYKPSLAFPTCLASSPLMWLRVALSLGDSPKSTSVVLS
ncbi:hypothetical protein GQ53DRAFT_744982 [Thozetella sp. PMI_491]|nr:hypothetical protein GQ53DRAFT_744982 [Thozetella sp. PMI_491]